MLRCRIRCTALRSRPATIAENVNVIPGTGIAHLVLLVETSVAKGLVLVNIGTEVGNETVVTTKVIGTTTIIEGTENEITDVTERNTTLNQRLA